jgi:hypothetical protein
MMRITVGVQRALDRIAKGETPYSAAMAEGISLSTIYRVQKRLREQGIDPKGVAPAERAVVHRNRPPAVANFSVTTEEIQLFQAAADKLGMSRASFCREACVKDAKKVLGIN